MPEHWIQRTTAKFIDAHSAAFAPHSAQWPFASLPAMSSIRIGLWRLWLLENDSWRLDDILSGLISLDLWMLSSLAILSASLRVLLCWELLSRVELLNALSTAFCKANVAFSYTILSHGFETSIQGPVTCRTWTHSCLDVADSACKKKLPLSGETSWNPNLQTQS